MVLVNLGSISCSNLQPEFAYGVVRSSSLPVDALLLAIQSVVLGKLFDSPALGATEGVILSLTDRLFAPLIDAYVPGGCFQVMGLPLGSKNIVLALCSMSTTAVLSRLVKKIERKIDR